MKIPEASFPDKNSDVIKSNFMIFLADLCGVLVDRDTNAEVWLLQGLDITKRIGELAP